MAQIHIDTNDLHIAGRCLGDVLAEFLQGFREGENAYFEDLRKVMKEEDENEKASGGESAAEAEEGK